MTNQLPQPTPPTRQKAFDVVDGEREYQDVAHPSSPHPTLVEETNLLIEFTDKLAVAVTVQHPSPKAEPSEILREIASIAIRAMENHGVKPRENHVPASAGITGIVKAVAKSDSTKPAPKPAVATAPTPPVHPAAAPAHPPAHPTIIEHHPVPVPHGEKK